jgi:hypothetical protein
MAHPVQRSPERSNAHSVAGPVGTAPVAPASGAVIRPQRQLATAAIVLACAVGAAAVGATISSFGVERTLDEIAAGGQAPSVLPYDAFVLGYDVIALVAGVVTAVWLYGARANSEVISSFRHRRSPVWSWLGWLVPVVAWWFPRQVVEDVRRASSPNHTPPARVMTWWALWVTGVTGFQMADRVAFGDDDLTFISVLGPFNLLSTLCLLGALVLWVQIVLDIVRLQEAAARAGAGNRTS